MPINSFLYPGAKVTTGYNVANSLRFNDGSTDYLTKSTVSPTDNTKGTFSCWFKRGNLGGTKVIFGGGTNIGVTSGTKDFRIYLDSDYLEFYQDDYSVSGNNTIRFANTLLRDCSAWYHLCVAIDTAQSDNANKVKFYLNNTQLTANYTSLGESFSNIFFNTASLYQHIGVYNYNTTQLFDGYMAEVVFVDGQQLDPTSFGEFDEDSPTIWKPKDVSGLTFGNNGFYLDFENASSLGADVSGNSNNFTVNNLTSVDQSTDTCTNNFATLNPLVYGNSPTLSEGNLKFSSSDANWRASVSTIGFTQGKWYAEFKLDSANDYVNTGIATMSHFQQTTNVKIGYTSTSYGYDANNGNYYVGDSATSYGASLSSGDILGVALDLDNNKLYFSKNGTFQNSGNPASGSTGTGAISITSGLEYFIATSAYGSGKGASANFGSPSFSISSGNSDANGYGNFEYSVPSGYYSINTKNLAEFG